MKFLMLLDNNEYVVLDPEQLELRQIADGKAAIGVTVQVPVEGKEGETQPAFRPFIEYPVNLSLAKSEAQ